jgi:hypothetical protein
LILTSTIHLPPPVLKHFKPPKRSH